MSPRKAAASHSFLATIYRIWMMRHVDVPEDVVAALVAQMPRSGKEKAAKPKYIPVIAMVNGKGARTTLVPAGAGRYRMQINAAQRRAGDTDTGDAVSVKLRIDLGSREVKIPDDLRTALAKHPKARKAFEEMPPGHRRQLLLWTLAAKRSETRRKHIERALDHLLERALLRPRQRST